MGLCVYEVPTSHQSRQYQVALFIYRWKTRCKKLEREVDRSKHTAEQTIERNEQIHKELEANRTQLTTGNQQMEHLKRELGELLAWRAQQDENVNRKDSEVTNRLTSVVSDPGNFDNEFTVHHAWKSDSVK